MIRKAMEEDLKYISEIDALCFKNAWDFEQYTYELKENPFSYIYVFENENRIIGFIDFWITFEQAQLCKIVILPEYRGMHLADELMKVMFEICDDEMCEICSLEVRISNTSAISLYERNGFMQVNVRKNYYDDGEDAYLMVKALGGAYS